MAGSSNLLFKRGRKEDGGEWDDSKLIEAYDKAMMAAKEKNKKKVIITGDGKILPNKKGKWKIGDYCLAIYYKTCRFYEAQIVDMDETRGTCVVHYLGYDDKKEVSLADVCCSRGKWARERQMALIIKKDSEQWQVGDMCEARYYDGRMYSVEIIEIYEDRKSCLVNYFEYGSDYQVVSFADLEPTVGVRLITASDEDSSTSQADQSGDETSSNYSSEASSMTASENNPVPSRDQRHSTVRKPKSHGPFTCSGVKHRHRRSSSHEHPHHSSYEESFLPGHHLPLPMNGGDVAGVDDELGSMLIAWYMAGYHTGFYQAARLESENRSRRSRHHH